VLARVGSKTEAKYRIVLSSAFASLRPNPHANPISSKFPSVIPCRSPHRKIIFQMLFSEVNILNPPRI